MPRVYKDMGPSSNKADIPTKETKTAPTKQDEPKTGKSETK